MLATAVNAERTSASLVANLEHASRSGTLGEYRVVVMNDFSLDRCICVDDIDEFIDRLRKTYSQKGGLLPQTRQMVNQGGCAANTATTLARLGAGATFITRTSELGRVLLDYYLGRAGVDLSRVKDGGTLAVTSCIEIGENRYNIMVNDGESYGGFGFADLDQEDLRLIQNAHVAGVFDWCLNCLGTDLAEGLFQHCAGTEVMTYLDTSDPAPRRAEIPELFDRVLTLPSLSHLNLNENELKQVTGGLAAGDAPGELIELAQELKAKVIAALTVHTEHFSFTLDGAVTLVPTYRARPLRTTGAGDSWNGGNILGLLLGLPPTERLLLANAVAAFYIESPSAQRPTLEELIRFIKSRRDDLRKL